MANSVSTIYTFTFPVVTVFLKAEHFPRHRVTLTQRLLQAKHSAFIGCFSVEHGDSQDVGMRICIFMSLRQRGSAYATVIYERELPC